MRSLFRCTFLLLVFVVAPVAAKSTVRIARDPSWFPLNLGLFEPRLLAFSDGLVTTIGLDEGFTVSFSSVTWETIATVLKTGRVDGVLTAMPPLPQFRTQYDFSDIYLYLGPVLVVAKQTPATSLDDMAGKIVGAQAGSTAMLLAARVPQVVIEDFTSVGKAFEALVNGQIDGVLVEALTAYAFVNDSFADRLKIATPPLTNEGLRLIVAKGKNGELLEQFNRGLHKLVENSTYFELAEKWKLNLSPSFPQ